MMVFVRAASFTAAVLWSTIGAVTEAGPLTVRVQWGGGTPQAWAGTVEVIAADATGRLVRVPFRSRTLSTDPDAAALAHASAGVVQIHQPRPVASDGMELTVEPWEAARLVARLASADGRQPVVLDVPLVDLLATPAQDPLDAVGNRLTARVPADAGLHVQAAAGAGDDVSAEALGLVRMPGDRLRLRVDPLLATRLQGGHSAELRMRLKSPQGVEAAVQTTPLVALPDAAGLAERGFAAFEPVIFDVTLPAEEGVSSIELEAFERGGLRWSRPLAARSIEIAAIAEGPVEAAGAEPWKTIYELDPGSPRLLERLRRLPGVSLPTMTLPEMPLPSLSKATAQLPRLPSMPMPSVPMPAVPMPSVSSMVPRLGGPLSHGHSALVTHPLGPMFRLPAAAAAAQPSWEGVVLAGVQPGMPHAVEVDYPSDQNATVGLVVLEADAAGVVVEPRHVGGFEVRRPPGAEPAPRIMTHRFIVWPTTKHPLLVIANPSTRQPALIGRVRLSAGPTKLPAEPPRASPILARAGAAPRRLHAFLDAPDVARNFGGSSRFVAHEGRAIVDWAGHVAAGRHLVELAASQGAAGTMLTACAQGAALWPSAALRQAPRWEQGYAGERDVLAAVARLHARHGLSLIPAVRFDAPLPAVEAALFDGTAGVGVGCIGRDGKPRRLASGSLHYNALHPLVHEAVEELVVEMARRVRGSAAVTGVALVLPHDGWLHLPGLAWPLDDDTFARFAATLPEPPVADGDGRFAERARLVEGPFREAWLAWRCAEISRFHARLAAAVAAVDGRWTLHVVPTTLFAVGDLAAPRPGEDDDRVRLAGLDPALSQQLPEADRVIHAWPWVHEAADEVRESATIAAGNRAEAVLRAAAASRRRAAVVIERPRALDVTALMPLGPFGAATLRGPVTTRPVAARSQGLAEAITAGDAEAVFDGGLLAEAAARSSSRTGFESMPMAAAERVLATDRPLTVRLVRRTGLTWALVSNAGAAAVTARLTLAGSPLAIVDASDGTPLAATPAGDILLPLEAWGVRCLLLEGHAGVTAAKADYAEDVRRDLAARVERLRQRRAVLEAPLPLDVLDNPAFELGTAPADGRPAASIAGWEVVEPRRGALALVAGGGGAERPGRGLEFASVNGLATLRSNPFPSPASGRISVAAWLRVADSSVQPPLRIAIEGVQDDREYYRFAAIGGLTGGRPLTGEWQQFVLQVDELPVDAIESLRVRFDLLGPGRVQIDDVRVFDLAFDDSQRSQITKAVSLLDHQQAGGDLGGCLVGLDGYWPRFLEAYMSDAAVAAAEAARAPAAAPAATPPPEERQAGGVFDRLRSWWQ